MQFKQIFNETDFYILMFCFFCSEEAIRQSGNPTTKSVAEMENHVFQKAKTKVNKIIFYIFCNELYGAKYASFKQFTNFVQQNLFNI